MADNRPLPSSSQAGLIGGEPGLCCVLNVRAAPWGSPRKGSGRSQPLSPTRGITHPCSLKRHHEAARREAVVALDPDAASAIAFRDSLNSVALMQVVLQGIDNAKMTSKPGVPGAAGAPDSRGKTD